MLKVPRLGEKTFEQAAGFLRINGGKEPLDASAVHPEAYPIVAKMLAQQGITAAELIGNRERVKQIKASDFTDERFGLPTILDILSELENPAVTARRVSDGLLCRRHSRNQRLASRHDTRRRSF